MNIKKAGVALLPVAGFFLWICYAISYLYFRQNSHAESIAGYLSFLGEVGLDFVAAILSFFLFKKNSKGPKKIVYLLFFLSFVSALIADSVYNFLVNILQITNFSSFSDSLFDIPFIGFLFFQCSAWILIFLKENKNNFFMIPLYLPVMFIAVSIFGVFVFGLPWKLSHFSLVGLYQFIDTFLEIVGFCIAIICLSRFKNISIFFLSIGYMIIVSSDLLIRSNVVEEILKAENIFETTWVLGLYIMCFGLVLERGTIRRKWLTDIQSLQSQISLWVFAISLVAMFVFLISCLAFSFHDKFYLLNISENLPAIFILFSMVSVIGSNFISRKLALPFFKIENILKKFKVSEAESPLGDYFMPNSFILEFRNLEKFILKAFKSNLEKYQIELKLLKTTRQVAHDIRSPLAVLEFATQDLAQIPEEHREMIRSSVSRINDIANNLLIEYRANKNKETENHLQPELVYSILDSIISEKRLACTHKNIELQFLPEENALGGFAKINAMQFKRVLSNLINNAAEAIKNAGKITVKLFQKDDLLVIEIEDNGCGIPEDILPKILAEGFTAGKEGGSGLGLSYAVSSIKSWGGKHAIFSRVQEGTRFVIFLPIITAPEWFVEKIYLGNIQNIFILDDDNSIHLVWKNRLEKIAQQNHMLLKDFYTAKELIQYIKQNSGKLKTDFAGSLFFIDYELFGSAMNGLEVIQHLNIATSAILVTSQYESETVREECSRLGVKILPKSYAAYIPIQVNLKNIQNHQPIVFIDDNKRLTDAWLSRAETKNVPLAVFNKVPDLLEALDGFSKDTVFYIDHDLGGAQSGEELAKMLYNKDYKNLYLATGYEAGYFKHLPFIKGVIGKMPIF